jgi:acid stress-induced BolA-like protein IbaG/YrbA
MADAKNLKQARTVYDTMCEMLDDRNWHYKKDEENL